MNQPEQPIKRTSVTTTDMQHLLCIPLIGIFHVMKSIECCHFVIRERLSKYAALKPRSHSIPAKLDGS